MRRAEHTRGRFWTNAASQVVVLGANALVGLLFTPFLVEHLGVAAFGLVPLATSIASYFGFVIVSVQASIGRHLTIALESGDTQRALRVFNTMLFGGGALVAVLLPLAGAFSWAMPALFDVPAGLESEARVFFMLVLSAYLLATGREIFGAGAFARNRLDLQNAARVVEIVLRVGVPVAAFLLIAPRLAWVGAGSIVGSVASLAVAVAVWRVMTPELSISPASFDRGALRDTLGTSGWIVVGQLGAALNLAIDLAVVNLMLGAVAAGRFGVVAVWPVFLRSLAGAFAGVLGPTMMSKVARGDMSGLAEVTRGAVRLLGIGIGLPVALAAGLSAPLLSAWMGPGYADLRPLMVVSVGYLAAALATLPLPTLNLALDRVRVPGLVTLASGVVNLGLSVWWARLGSDGLGVALASLVVLTAKDAVFMPVYAARSLGRPWHAMLPDVLPGMFLSAAFGAAGLALAGVLDLASWPALVAVSGVVAVAYSGVAWLFIPRGDRDLLRRLVVSRGASR